jgi:hypothetical protein
MDRPTATPSVQARRSDAEGAKGSAPRAAAQAGCSGRTRRHARNRRCALAAYHRHRLRARQELLAMSALLDLRQLPSFTITIQVYTALDKIAWSTCGTTATITEPSLMRFQPLRRASGATPEAQQRGPLRFLGCRGTTVRRLLGSTGTWALTGFGVMESPVRRGSQPRERIPRQGGCRSTLLCALRPWLREADAERTLFAGLAFCALNPPPRSIL